MADRNSVYKLAAKEIAHFHGRSVSFMAKYDFNDTGSSCHIHSSLWTLDGETAVFDDHHGPHGMSETFQHYLAGQIATAREFSLLWAPTINSYKRFQLGSWAPTGVGWGIDNRTLGFRKVGHGAGTRVECRIPGADANSYFAFAGTIAHFVGLVSPPTWLLPEDFINSMRSMNGARTYAVIAGQPAPDAFARAARPRAQGRRPGATARSGFPR